VIAKFLGIGRQPVFAPENLIQFHLELISGGIVLAE
jgi:hypothetical protein